MRAPYLYIAFACESIPEDGKVPIKRLQGKVTGVGDQKTMPPSQLTFTLFMGFVAGEYTGKAIIDIQPVSPSGQKMPRQFEEVEFEQPLTHKISVSAIVEDFPIQESGVYWFDVKLNGNPVARIPLEVSYRQRKRTRKQQLPRSKKQVPLGFRKS